MCFVMWGRNKPLEISSRENYVIVEVLPQVVKLPNLLHIHNAKLGLWVWGECRQPICLFAPFSSQLTWNLKGRNVILIIQTWLLLLTLYNVWLEKETSSEQDLFEESLLEFLLFLLENLVKKNPFWTRIKKTF
jgi:hypothetical protein